MPFLWLLLLLLADAAPPHYSTRFFTQPLDHFNYFNNVRPAPTLKQRYLFSAEHWQAAGPILFYAGNEGDIEGFSAATGLMWELAPKLCAMVVFAEERYYGQSMPETFPYNSSDPNYRFRYLSTQQVLADHAALVSHIRSTNLGAWSSAVIAVGGSYGGMLAAWLRYQWPHLVDGALAASAPVAGFEPTGVQSVYSVVDKDYAKCGNGSIAKMQEAMRFLYTSRVDTTSLTTAANALDLCPSTIKQLVSNPDRTEALIGWLQQQLFVMAELDYPYPSSFMDYMLPANPVTVACRRFDAALNASATHPAAETGEELVRALAAAVSVVANSSGKVGCYQLPLENISFISTLPGFIPGAWTYQRCSEVIIPYATGNTTSQSSVFLPCCEFAANCWDESRFADWCFSHYGVLPTPLSEAVYFGGANLTQTSAGFTLGGASNIIFSNGDLDPWGAGGIHSSLNSAASVVAIAIEGGAHHLDLRYSNPLDPPSVVQARAEEERMIRKWIAEKANRTKKD